MEYKRFVLKLQCVLVVYPITVIPNYKNSGFPFRSTNRILFVLLRLLTCIVILVSIRSNTVKKPKSLKSIIFESQGVIFFYCTWFNTNTLKGRRASTFKGSTAETPGLTRQPRQKSWWIMLSNRQTVFACLYYFGALSRSNRPSLSSGASRRLPSYTPVPDVVTHCGPLTDSGAPTTAAPHWGETSWVWREESVGHEVNIRNAARRRLSRFGRGHALLNSNIPSPGSAEARDLPAF